MLPLHIKLNDGNQKYYDTKKILHTKFGENQFSGASGQVCII